MSGPAVQRVALVDLFGESYARYAPRAHPRDLERSPNTALSVTGTVLGIQEGPKFSDADPDMPLSGRMIRMNIKVESIGKSTGSRPDQIGVLLFQGARELGEFQAALPAGTEVALYLTIAQDLEADAPQLYLPVTPQGFIVGDADGVGVTYPMEHRVNTEARLSELAPDRQR